MPLSLPRPSPSGPLGSVGRHLRYVGPTVNLASRYMTSCPAKDLQTGCCIHVAPDVAIRASAAGYSVTQGKDVFMKGARELQQSWVVAV